MDLYKIRKASDDDIHKIVEIYNSNKLFLVNHLGLEYVDEDFIGSEISEMENMGFQSCVVADVQTGDTIGVMDFKPDADVYLSLIMIDSRFHGKGTGTLIYKVFENEMQKSGKYSIRIDVVNDYDANVVEFWKKQGFIPQDEIHLKWGNKNSKALTMIKNICK